MNTMGEFGVLCSKMASKLIIGGCTYLGRERSPRAGSSLEASARRAHVPGIPSARLSAAASSC